MSPSWIFFLGILSASVGADQRGGHKTASSDFDLEEYLSGVCYGNGGYDSVLPCNVVANIDYQCLSGIDARGNEPQPACLEQQGCQSVDFQRTCFCQSQYLDSVQGCRDCYVAHGGEGAHFLTAYDWDLLPQIMDDYCNPAMEPTAVFGVYLGSVATTVSYTSTTKWSDPLGYAKTEISLYYTPSLTGVEAWSTELSTISDGSSDLAMATTSSARATDFTPAANGSDTASTFSDSATSIPSHAGPSLVIITPISLTTEFVRATSSSSRTSGAGALYITCIGIGCIFGISTFVAIVLML